MDKITTSEIVTLDNNKEYYCFQTLTDNDKEYIYLVSTSQPIEVRFAEQRIINGALSIRILDEQTEKIHALELFKAKHHKTVQSAPKQ